MKSLDVHYFAQLKEITGRDTETIPLHDELTYADLYQTLAKRYRFPLPLHLIQVAVDDEFSEMENEIRPGARVVFIPPMAGG